MDIYTAFRDMVDSLLEMHLEELGVTGEQFAAVCEAAAQQQEERVAEAAACTSDMRDAGLAAQALHSCTPSSPN